MTRPHSQAATTICTRSRTPSLASTRYVRLHSTAKITGGTGKYKGARGTISVVGGPTMRLAG